MRWPPPQGPGLRGRRTYDTQRFLFVYKSGLWLNFTDWTGVRLQTLPWTQSWLQFYATTGKLAMWDADMGSGHQSWKFTVTRYEERKTIFWFVSSRVFAWIWRALKIPTWLACRKISRARFETNSTITPEWYDTKSSYQLIVSITKCENLF